MEYFLKKLLIGLTLLASVMSFANEIEGTYSSVDQSESCRDQIKIKTATGRYGDEVIIVDVSSKGDCSYNSLTTSNEATIVFQEGKRTNEYYFVGSPSADKTIGGNENFKAFSCIEGTKLIHIKETGIITVKYCIRRTGLGGYGHKRLHEIVRTYTKD